MFKKISLILLATALSTSSFAGVLTYEHTPFGGHQGIGGFIGPSTYDFTITGIDTTDAVSATLEVFLSDGPFGADPFTEEVIIKESDVNGDSLYSITTEVGTMAGVAALEGPAYWRTTGTFDVSSYLGDMLAGNFTVSLSSGQSDWYYKKSKLTITSAEVPEPASLGIFGLGLLSIAALRRRRKA